MSAEIRMPKLSDTMEEGKILRWLKKPGDRIEPGEVIAEVETDKADMELEAFDEGVLDEVLVNEGDNASVGDVIARLREDGTGKAPASEEAGKDRPGEPPPGKEAKPSGGGRKEPEKSEKAPSRKAPEEVERSDVREVKKQAPAKEAERSSAPARKPKPASQPSGTPASETKVSPAAEELAAGEDVDLSRLTGTGPAGRVVRRDVERFLHSRKERAKRTEPPGERRGQREELSNIRRTVAHRMAESKRETPHFYMTTEIDMEECARLRRNLEDSVPDEPRVNFTHFLVRASALALQGHPRVNARYLRDDAIEYPDGVHVGLAVALEEGLIVAVLHDCDRKGLFELAGEARELIERVRSGKFHGDDLTGGTFTISNLGMFPVEDFAAVINPPQAAVLAVGAVGERPVVRDGGVVARTTMRVTLSSDHRVIDGIEAARFLETLKELLENPLRLLLERG